MTKHRILIAGGDTRQLYCAERLAREYDVRVLGFDREFFPEGSVLTDALPSEKGSFDCAVLPVPPLDDKGNIYTPCFRGEISADTVSELLAEEGCVFAGRADDKLRRAMQGRSICDYLLREELNLKNAVPTAEGAVQLALEELPVTLSGLDVLIVGLGRIGTALAEILKGFGARVTAAVRDTRGAAKSKLHGISSVPVKRIDGRYGLVFNTVPALILNRDILSRFRRDTLFIDLASKPGGIVPEAASELGLRVVWALGLPGKTAPVTAGEIIAETVSAVLAERGEAVE